MKNTKIITNKEYIGSGDWEFMKDAYEKKSFNIDFDWKSYYKIKQINYNNWIRNLLKEIKKDYYYRFGRR